MKKYVSIALLFFISFIVFASEIIEIPFYYDNEKKAIFLYAEIAGKKGYFLFDTGCDCSVIFDNEEKYKNYKQTSSKAIITLLNIDISNTGYILENVVLSGNKLQVQSKFYVTSNPKVIKFLPKIEGIIGLNIFKDKMFEISMTDSVIRIHDKKPDSYIFSSLIDSEYLKKDKGIVIPIMINTKSYNAVIDTGAYDICLSEYTLDNGNWLAVRVFNPEKHPYQKDYFIVKKDIELLGVKLTGKVLNTHRLDGITENLIGMNFLSKFDLLFDLRNIENPILYYRPIVPINFFNLFFDNDKYGSGFAFLLGGDTNIVVSDIIEDSPAWKAGLRAGTLITHLNAKPILEYSINDIKNLINTTIEIIFIDSNGKEKTIKIKPKKML